MDLTDYVSLGATMREPDNCLFRVWAPRAKQVTVHLLRSSDCQVKLLSCAHDYHEAEIEGVRPGQRYYFRLGNGPDRPDPASRFQPEGVHGPSEVVEPFFAWGDEKWQGLPLTNLVLYELHIGTFTPEGTFDAAINQLPRLRDLGVTAVEVMPVAQFPGARNWGYDGVYPFAVQNSYGGPLAFKRFIDACHRHGLAAILDVVYNHLGPEGNYFSEFGPYFTNEYRTPWGEAINFDRRGCDEVRRFFLANALCWQREFHLDGLRLDSVPNIRDGSVKHLLAELSELTGSEAARLGRPFHLIAESDLNDVKLLKPQELGGYGLSAQWSDDFHHALHAYLTGERRGYYADHGTLDHLVRAYRDVFVLTGQYSHFRGRRFGAPATGRPAEQFVICTQNHDQIGNRALGDRLSSAVDFETLKLAAGLMLLSPYLPLIFMGEEYDETAPFPFFTSHHNPRLVEAVRQGRRREFAAFAWQGEIPDPQDETTFKSAKLSLQRAECGPGKALHDFYRECLRLRRRLPALADLNNERLDVIGFDDTESLLVRRWTDGDEIIMLYQMGKESAERAFPLAAGKWQKLLSSADNRWQGPSDRLPDTLDSHGEVKLRLPRRSFVVFRRQ